MKINLNFRAIGMTGLAYFVLGWLGLALAIPPGYASPVFPAAGLALAMLLHFGRAVLPGIWLGSLAINVLMAWQSGSLTSASVLAAMGLACGATLQGWCARVLVQRWIGDGWRRLETEREILRLLVFGGPLACLVSATVGVSVLVFSGIIHRPEIAFSWWSWWLGDTLGVLIFAPLVLAFLLRAQQPWRERLRSVVAPMLIVVLLVAAAFVATSYWERQRQMEAIGEHGESLAQLLQIRFLAHQEALSSLRRLVEVMPEMDFRQFEYFTRITLKDNPDVFALSYNHYVTSKNRSAYEASVARKSPFKDFRITERDADRQLVPAADRPEYVPVSFIAPLQGNRPAIGFDIYSKPVRHEAIEKARKTAQPVVTAPIQLVQENQKRIGLLILHPAYRQSNDDTQDASASELAGFSVGVVKVDEMVRIAVSKKLLSGLVFHLDDVEAPAANRLLYRSEGGEATSPSPYEWKKRLAMADRVWEITLFPNAQYLSQHRPWTAWLVGVVGLMLAVLLQLLMLAMTGRTALIQRKVNEQTAEIQSKNAALLVAMEQQRLLSAAVSQSHSSVIITDARGDIVFVNEAFVVSSGYCREEVLGRNPRLLKSGTTPAEVYESLWRTLLDRQTWRGELQNRKKTGDIFWELATISPVTDENGKISHFIAIEENITDRKRQEVELKQAKEDAEAANLAKSRFLATMSHEIRTPMNGIIGLSQLALERDLAPQARQYLERIHLSSRSLLGILNDILDYSKIESGKMTLERSAFHLDDLLERLQTLFSLYAEEKSLAFSITAEPEVPRSLIGDPLRLQQILSNLLGNAIKFTDAGKVSLRVSLIVCENDRASIHWRVEDTGIGMDSSALEHLFESFRQADNSISRRFGGTGLGLAISRNLLLLMGSDFHVESKPGHGCVFDFNLCLEVANEAVQRNGEHSKLVCSSKALTERLATLGRRLSGKRILLAEDNLINQQVVKEFLLMSGIRVDIAENGLEVLEKLRKCRFDAILMDVSMPEMDGQEATRRIRGSNEHPLLPIIALTAGVTVEERANSLACGMNDIVAKPIDPEELLRTLLHWITPEAASESPPEVASVPFASGVPLELPGFDLTRLSLMLGNDEAQLIRLLKLFGEDMDGMMQELETALSAGEISLAKALAHKIKGAAGNAGAMQLHQSAERVDSELHEGRLNPASMSALCLCYDEALAAIKAIKADVGLDRNHDPQALASVFARIEPFLSSQELVPDALLIEMESLLPEDQVESFHLMQRYIENIDYSQALEVLRAMKK